MPRKRRLPRRDRKARDAAYVLTGSDNSELWMAMAVLNEMRDAVPAAGIVVDALVAAAKRIPYLEYAEKVLDQVGAPSVANPSDPEMFQIHLSPGGRISEMAFSERLAVAALFLASTSDDGARTAADAIDILNMSERTGDMDYATIGWIAKKSGINHHLANDMIHLRPTRTRDGWRPTPAGFGGYSNPWLPEDAGGFYADDEVPF